MKLVIYGDPRTKKNSQRILMAGNKRFISPSKAYEKYAEEFIVQVPRTARRSISEALSVRCVYYMQTRRRVDLVNLLEATDDLLVRALVIEDDNSKIVASHDGSRVLYDKQNPRVEITIERLIEDGK